MHARFKNGRGAAHAGLDLYQITYLIKQGYRYVAASFVAENLSSSRIVDSVKRGALTNIRMVLCPKIRP